MGETQKISLQRGMAYPVTDQMIDLSSNGILISAGDQVLSLTSLQEITLSVAGGLSSISLTPAGIVLQGPLIQIN